MRTFSDTCCNSLFDLMSELGIVYDHHQYHSKSSCSDLKTTMVPVLSAVQDFRFDHLTDYSLEMTFTIEQLKFPGLSINWLLSLDSN